MIDSSAFDFQRHLPPICVKCGYPFPHESYPMKVIDCPEHRPAHWKYYEDRALDKSIAAEIEFSKESNGLKT
jgi:hypothetical protein